jgi:hypothetical protein
MSINPINIIGIQLGVGDGLRANGEEQAVETMAGVEPLEIGD